MPLDKMQRREAVKILNAKGWKLYESKGDGQAKKLVGDSLKKLNEEIEMRRNFDPGWVASERYLGRIGYDGDSILKLRLAQLRQFDGRQRASFLDKL